MKNKKDPKWISQADRIYGGFLYLFPAAHRKEFGPWMRQAFRDRCREVARGEQSLFRVLAAEIVPDLLLGVGREHVTSNFGEISRKHMAALTLLGCLSLWALFHETVNQKLFDLVAVSETKIQSLKYGYHSWQAEKRTLKMAEWLVAEDGSPKAKALAANIYLGLHKYDTHFPEPEHEGLCEFQKKAANLVSKVMTEHPDLRTAAYAELACFEANGCDSRDKMERLIEQDTNNSYVWLRALRIALAHDDKIAERFAIKGLATANHHENYQKMMEFEMSDLIKKFSPTDDTLAENIEYIALEEYPSVYFLARSSCIKSPVPTMEPELVNDCRKAADALSSTDDFVNTSVTSRLTFRLSTDESERESAYQNFRNSIWWRDAYYRSRSSASQQQERQAWREKWRGKSRSVVAIKESLASLGMSTYAPDDFEVSPYDKAQWEAL